jgi:hypothetical protein
MGILGTAVASAATPLLTLLAASLRPPGDDPRKAAPLDPPIAEPSGSLPPDAEGAVVIPAHNEAAVIGATLRSLRPLLPLAGIEVIVVCNGCTDATADIARGFEGVKVVETSRPSKTEAMNLGDAAATRWPRLYLDADIEIPPSAVLAVFRALAVPGVYAARPSFAYDTTGATMPVRGYYRARSRIPAPIVMWGAGGYAANESGHRRFGTFANVTADDSWFDAQFTEEEKRVVATPPARVRTARDTAALLAVLTRQRRGPAELRVSSQSRIRGLALIGSIRGIRSAVDVAWYVSLTVIARYRAARLARRGVEPAWERDASTRAVAGRTR